DLGDELDEVMADIEPEDAALTERKPGEQVEGDGREAEAAGHSCQHRQHKCESTDLDERSGGGGPPPAPPRPHHASSGCKRCRPSGVPTATTRSPSATRASGPGAGMVVLPRMMATIDAPVFVRKPPSPMVAPANRAPVGTVSQSMATPSSC